MHAHLIPVAAGGPVAAAPAGSTGTGGPDAADGWLLALTDAGDMTMKGIRCPLAVTAEFLELDGGQAHVRACAVVDRREAGVTVPRLLAGHAVGSKVTAVLRPPRAVQP